MDPWYTAETFSTYDVGVHTVAKMGLQPEQMMDTEWADVAACVQVALENIWNHYPWPQVLEVATVTPNEDGTLNAPSHRVQGVYELDPLLNPGKSSITFRQHRNKIYLEEKYSVDLFVRYWPKVPLITSTHLRYTGSDTKQKLTDSLGLEGYEVPEDFWPYLIIRAAGDYLAGGPQNEKAAILKSSAEHKLAQKQIQTSGGRIAA